MTILTDKKADHLILLVGGNPLPNYVAAKVLMKQSGQLCLVHTDATLALARRLHRQLLPEDAVLEKSKQVTYLKVDEGDPQNIYDQVARHVNGKSFGIHLNYTGGTKTMSVHAVRAVEDTCPNYAEFSYLDAKRLSLLTHRANRSESQIVLVEDALNVSLETLMALHDVKLDARHARPTDQINTELLPLCQAIVNVCGARNGVSKWKDWQIITKGFTELPIGLSGFEDVDKSLAELCDGNPTPELVAQKIGFPELRACQKWFRGEFLEVHVHHALQRGVTKLGSGFVRSLRGIHCVQDAITYNDGTQQKNCAPMVFEFDVGMMHHYRLILLSCLLSADTDRCKEHFVEAYVRARQLGGDEARVALVSVHDRPQEVECKLASIWGASTHAKVFGAPHLSDLENHLYDWLR